VPVAPYDDLLIRASTSQSEKVRRAGGPSRSLGDVGPDPIGVLIGSGLRGDDHVSITTKRWEDGVPDRPLGDALILVTVGIRAQEAFWHLSRGSILRSEFVRLRDALSKIQDDEGMIAHLQDARREFVLSIKMQGLSPVASGSIMDDRTGLQKYRLGGLTTEHLKDSVRWLDEIASGFPVLGVQKHTHPGMSSESSSEPRSGP
jgi:hypothetical protein